MSRPLRSYTTRENAKIAAGAVASMVIVEWLGTPLDNIDVFGKFRGAPNAGMACTENIPGVPVGAGAVGSSEWLWRAAEALRPSGGLTLR